MTDKPTKSQRRRANERRKKKVLAKIAKKLGSSPSYLQEIFPESNLTEIPGEHKEPWEKAPKHMVVFDKSYEEATPEIDKEKQSELTNSASYYRADDAVERCKELKEKYRKFWCVKGGARRILNAEIEEFDREKVENKNIKPPPSLRTIQRCMKNLK